MDCRGQSYDNASNMSGKYNGTQQLIKNHCPQATWIPCMAHSLNLVGKCAADSCPQATALFSLIEKIYVFLSASTHRWGLHCQALDTCEGRKLKVKRICETRWSARADAVTALRQGYKESLSVLEGLSSDPDELADTRSDALGFVNQLSCFDTILLLEIWDIILERLQATSAGLQTRGLSLNVAVQLLKSLQCFVSGLRDRFDEIESSAVSRYKDVVDDNTPVYQDTVRRPRKRKAHFDDGPADDVVLTGKDRFRVNVFLPIIDSICLSLNKRLGAYQEICDLFGFLANFRTASVEELTEAARKLSAAYPNDIEPEFSSELIQFSSLFRELCPTAQAMDGNGNIKSDSVELEMFNLIQCNGLHEFQNVEICSGFICACS